MSRPNGPVSTWDSPRRWWQGRLGLGALAVALALIAAGVYWLTRPADTGCADGVAKRGPDHACVGLTDGSYAFSRDLAPVFNLIHQENQQVAQAAASPGGPPAVSVVYLMTMVPEAGLTTTTDSIRHELQGAYTAQWEANHSHGQGDTPKIRLLLAQTGDSQEERDFTLGQIEARRAKDDIVAVAGLGTSTTSARTTIERLTRNNIAAFGSVLTSDALAGIPGLARVAPPNSDEAAAAAKYVQGAYPKAKVLLVQDRRSDDLYTGTLATSFQSAYPKDQQVAQPMYYDSSKSGVATYFRQAMANVCLDSPQVIYFAGRGVDLPDFLGPLANRPCASDPVTVVSGDDASLVERSSGIGEVKGDLKRGNIKLVYTGLAHPEAWSLRPQSFSQAAIAPFLHGGQYDITFPREPLADGQAIMGYDAVLTAVTAARAAAAGPTGVNPVTGSDVLQMMQGLHGQNAVSGASGLISLDPDGGPRNKAIPIVELMADGSVHTVAVSSRNGTPPDARPQGG